MKDKTLLYLGNKLASKGHNPTLIDVLARALQNESFKVYTYSSKSSKLLRFLDMVWGVLKHNSKIDYALIDTYSTFAFWFAYCTAKILKSCKVPYILILHGGNLPSRYTKSKHQTDWLLRNARLNVSPSDYLYEFFKSKGFSNIIKIRNPLQLESYAYQKRINPKPHILWVRAFAEIYNPILAIKTLERLLQTYPESKLCMVGPAKDGSFQECKSYVEKTGLPVKFTGKLTKKEWISLAEGYDIFINTTNIDNTPVSVIEAMALGMLVVSTNVGGIPYLLDDRKNAILVEPNNSLKLTEAVECLLKDYSLAKHLSKNARSKAEEFGWETIKLKWLEVLA